MMATVEWDMVHEKLFRGLHMETLYLITGAAGHLGSVITHKLVETGKLVRALAIPNEKHLPEKAEIYFGDVCDKESIRL